MNTTDLRAVLRDAVQAAVASIDLSTLVHDALPPLPPARATVTVIAAGKGAPAMALGALRRWKDRVARTLVVTTEGTDTTALPEGVEVLRAAHPVCDERSVAAAERALALVRGQTHDLALALISGGASALLEAPPPDLPLDTLRARTSELVLSGASIVALNTVRRHLSRVKGGRLAASAYPGRTLTLYASDVPGGADHDVGSGPTVPDPTTVLDARAVLRQVLGEACEHELLPYLSESMKPGTPEAHRTRARAVATPALLAERVARELARAAFSVRVEKETIRPAAELVETYAARAAMLSQGEAVIVPCEPLLRVGAGAGAGGRAGWLALALLPHLPDDVAFLAAASDGVDGTPGGGGACVTGDLCHALSASERERALSGFDDRGVHATLGTLLPGKPTGLNLTDVHVLARALP